MEQKVDTSFSNKNKVQKTDIPFKIARNYSGKRVYNIVEAESIREIVEQEPTDDANKHLRVSALS